MSEPTPLNERTTKAGATFVEEKGWSVPANYGNVEEEYQAAKTSAVLFDLSHRGKLEVSGEDAPSFLNNLSTNDIANMPLGAGCEAFLLTSTAKVISHLRIYHVLLHGGVHALLLDTEPGEGEKTIQHLDKYLISEQVELADRTREFAFLRLAGPQSRQVLQKALLDDVPDLEDHLHVERTFGTNAHANVRRHDLLALEGYDIVCLNEVAPTVWQLLTEAGAKPAGTEAHELLRVEAGMPVYGVDIDENRFVVEVDRIPQTICYEKGCFLGQEPIVMARDRGQAKRIFLGVKLPGDQAVAAGTKLMAEGKEAGVITSSIVSPALGSPIGLAYVRRTHQEPGTLLGVDGTDEQAQVMTIPFAGSR